MSEKNMLMRQRPEPGAGCALKIARRPVCRNEKVIIGNIPDLLGTEVNTIMGILFLKKNMKLQKFVVSKYLFRIR